MGRGPATSGEFVRDIFGYDLLAESKLDLSRWSRWKPILKPWRRPLVMYVAKALSGCELSASFHTVAFSGVLMGLR